MDKSQAMLNFIMGCPAVDKIYFNFADAKTGAWQYITNSDDVSMHKPYIDGSVQRRFTFSIDMFRQISDNPIVSSTTDLNLQEFEQAQSLIDWLVQQDDDHNYPVFDNCIIDDMQPTTTKPALMGIKQNSSPALAVYRITVQVNYLDNSKKLI